MTIKYLWGTLAGCLLFSLINLSGDISWGRGEVHGGGARGASGAGNRGGGQISRPSAGAARPSGGAGGRVSAGNARPSGGNTRPSGGGSRPPSLSNLQQSAGRPSQPSAGRGNLPPSMGMTRPSTSNRPSAGSALSSGSINRPGGDRRPPTGVTRPPAGGGSLGSPDGRPSVRPTGPLMPTTRPVPPSITGGDRPSLGGRPDGPATRPGVPGRPGGDRPSIGGNRPGGPDRPTTLPGNVTRPGGDRPSLGGISRPGDLTRPTFPPGDRPSLGGDRPGRPRPLPEDITRPSPGRPSFPGAGNRPGDRPGIGYPDRPGIGGNRPGGGYPDRPGIGGNRPGGGYPDRPGIGGNRPGGGYPDRPGIGGNRPGGGYPDRPGIGGNRPYPDRPIIGGVNRPSTRPNYRPDRPIIGGGNNNTIINNNVNNNFWNNNTNININNRPGGWGYVPGWGYRPVHGAGWGWSSGWGHHHNWYHGSWHHYSSNWYRPSSTFLFGWGLGSLSAYSTTRFYNPYYIETATPIYRYSTPIVIQDVQPVVIQETVQIENADTTPAPPRPDDAGLTAFNQGMADFKQGLYAEALVKFDIAIAKLPGDPVVHEMRALSYFALGQFQQSAAVLNALLATTPGMDWTTMSGLYGDVNDYTEQLRSLESHISSNPDDAAARFVLAYHYLVTGHTGDAIAELAIVTKLQPKDVTAQQILAGLKGARDAADPAIARAAEAPASLEAAKPAVDGPTTDLVGSWKATTPDVTIELTVTEEFGFTWRAAPKDKDPVELQGEISMQNDILVLGTENQGAMSGKVVSEGADQFRFTPPGAPDSEQGLTFVRQK